MIGTLLTHLGLAAAGAALGTTVLASLGFVRGFRNLGAWSLTFAVILFFLALTQLPLPDAAKLGCVGGGVLPNLVPFDFVRQFRAAWSSPGGIVPWLRSGALAAVMNLAIPALIGVLLARHGVAPGRALLLGCLVSLGAELTQLSATWGLFPCPYRKFDVDDLLLNGLGLALGLLGARAWRGRARAPG
jgi:glycopeptide antibiotics resistance protein